MILQNTKSLFSRAVEYSMYAFLVLFPFINYSLYLYSGTSTRTVNLVGMITVLAVVLGLWLFDESNKLSLYKSPILLSMALYGVSMTISAYFGFNFHTSFWSNVTRMTGIWYLICVGFFVLFLCSIMADPQKKRRLIMSVVLSTALYSFLYLFSFEGLGLIFKNYVDYAFTFGNSTFAGMYIFGAFLLAVYYLFSSEVKKWWAYVLPFVIILNPSILNIKRIFTGDWHQGLKSFIGEARASSIVIALSLILLLVVWLLSKIKDAKTRNKATVGAFVLLVLSIVSVSYSLLTPDGYVRKVYMSQATLARPLVWEVSDKVISDKPWLGWGGDNFERVFERYYDNRLLQDEYGNEAWFDRAHNIFIDQMIDGGYVGVSFYLLMYLSIGLCLLFVILRSRYKDDIILASILLVYFALHLLELQTAFDTSVSFIIVAFMIALSVDVFHRTWKVSRANSEIQIEGFVRYGGSLLILAFFGWTFFSGFVPFVRTQSANGYIRTVGYSEKRLAVYDTLFGSTIDSPAFLWRTSADLQRGIRENPSILNDEAKTKSINNEFKYLENKYKEYLFQNPEDYRSHLNLADILIYVRLFGDDRLAEAQQVLDQAVKLVPQNPQAYWMKAVAYLYQAKFAEARVWAEKATSLNPKIKESQNIQRYINDSIRTFPEIDLYFFRQT